jgi:hypothetical protein
LRLIRSAETDKGGSNIATTIEIVRIRKIGVPEGKFAIGDQLGSCATKRKASLWKEHFAQTSALAFDAKIERSSARAIWQPSRSEHTVVSADIAKIRSFVEVRQAACPQGAFGGRDLIPRAGHGGVRAAGGNRTRRATFSEAVAIANGVLLESQATQVDHFSTSAP